MITVTRRYSLVPLQAPIQTDEPLSHTRATHEQQTTTTKTKNEEDEAPERIERSSDGRLPIGLKQ